MSIADINRAIVERREIVRLSTNCWSDKRGLHIRRSLTPMKRKSLGHQMLLYDCQMTSADEVSRQILNLNECKDGLYVLIVCNESKDWETGTVDDYDFRLVPFTESATAPSPNQIAMI